VKNTASLADHLDELYREDDCNYDALLAGLDQKLTKTGRNHVNQELLAAPFGGAIKRPKNGTGTENGRTHLTRK